MRKVHVRVEVDVSVVPMHAFEYFPHSLCCICICFVSPQAKHLTNLLTQFVAYAYNEQRVVRNGRASSLPPPVLDTTEEVAARLDMRRRFSDMMPMPECKAQSMLPALSDRDQDGDDNGEAKRGGSDYGEHEDDGEDVQWMHGKASSEESLD
jgi:hypothetical protein